METFNSEKQFGGRKEYAIQPMQERLEECEIVVSMIHELLKIPLDQGGTIDNASVQDEGTYSYFRTFQYLDTPAGDQGWLWPLTEKTVEIHYNETTGRLTKEKYFILVSTRIHRHDITQDEITNVYEITYHGANHQSVVSTIDDIDFENSYGDQHVTRPATSYDHETLFTELGRLSDVYEVELRRNSKLES